MARIGIDFGGSKIEAAAVAADGAVAARLRRPNPGNYAAAMGVVRELVEAAEAAAGLSPGPVGVGHPGSLSPVDGRVRNANSTWLNGRPLAEDLAAALARPVRLANDADCLALSEAADGAAAGARTVFAAILGTGVGGGVAVDGRLLQGPNRIAGEWGHTPLPWPSRDEWQAAPACWCGRRGCVEAWLSGPALTLDFARSGGGMVDAAGIAARAANGDRDARAALDRHLDRLGRALAVVCDLIDPDVIVLGGGLSNIAALYAGLPAAVAPHVFSDVFRTPIVPAAHGDSSGVRGAAWLWPAEDGA